MKSLSRRALLGSSLLAATALTACTTLKNGNKTTLTLNTAKVCAYGQAGLNAVATILSITAVATAMGAPAVGIIQASSAGLSAALTAFRDETHGSLQIVYDNSSVGKAVNSLLLDLNAVATSLRAGLVKAQAAINNPILNTAITAFNALLTVIDAFEGLLGVSISGVSSDQEATALSILAVQK
ncbi:MAG: hypothetical protein ABF746_08780 [Acetobacter orientalis]|uniref:hypothetical protein n=1 Tax=Acetobacter orientalis TaxID=146474 RepID=UPI0039EC2039